MSAVWSLAHREVVRFVRQPSRVIGALVPPVFMWVLIGSGFGTSVHVPGAPEGSGFLRYFFPGTVVLVVLFASIFSTISVIEDRREGFLQGVLVAPIAPVEIALGKVLGGTALGLAQGAALLLLVPFLGMPWRSPAFLLALLVLVLVSLALTGLGFTIAWQLDSTQGFHAVMNLFLIPMWVLSGAFFPLAGAPAWLRAVTAVNPLTYAVAALRRALTPESAAGVAPWGTALTVTALFALAMTVISAAVVARRPREPR